MCGIAGYYALLQKLPSKETLYAFLDTLKHRGPDGFGHYFSPSEPLFLGHRRLKILDLTEKAKQPLPYANQRYWITFNGEIYNFLELQKELELLGHRFYSNSDTEIILASYVQWGPDCLLKFNGMWSFVIWDEKEKTLFLARDRFGVKPLFYYQDEKTFAFASELKAFFTFSVSFDEKQIANALQNPSTFEANTPTLVKNVFNFPSGHFAFFSEKKGLTLTKWWNTKDHLVSIPKSSKERAQEFFALFEDACKIRMRSDVPLASALSGGLDSSSILATMHTKHTTKWERTPQNWQSAYIARYPNTSQDEFFYAQSMIEKTKAKAFVIPITPNDFIKSFDKALYSLEAIFDLPIGPWLLYQQYRKNGHCISLDGHGADELLGGYYHHIESALVDSTYQFYNIRKIRSHFTTLQNYSESTKNISLLPTLKAAYKNRISQSTTLYNKLKLFAWLRRGISSKAPNWLHIEPERPKRPNINQLNDLLYYDFHTGTLPAILRNFDRCSMAHGIEIRSPFLDCRLVRYCFSLPASEKIGKGYTKLILRNAMKPYLPSSICYRKNKKGFASPLSDWYCTSLQSFFLDIVHSQSFLESSIWNGPKIKDFVEKCYQQKHPEKLRSVWEIVQAHRLTEVLIQK